ncbi:MAG: hypothetical protein EOQ32_29175 [Mesorhizobium sp.]|nr:hypothetical protein EJ067_12160 [Mesorhizobium sp. M1D.F.Ca.ET.043.01.1.1]RWA82709.1 MAG: hypothetical protein EOQ32_29175 [Mesorhizobium sp.]
MALGTTAPSTAAPLPARRWATRAIPGKVCNGFPSGIAQKQILRAVRRFYESLKRSKGIPGKVCAAFRPGKVRTGFWKRSCSGSDEITRPA